MNPLVNDVEMENEITYLHKKPSLTKTPRSTFKKKMV